MTEDVEIIDSIGFSLSLNQAQLVFFEKFQKKNKDLISDHKKCIEVMAKQITECKENLISALGAFSRELFTLSHIVDQDSGCKDNSHHYLCIMKIREQILSRAHEWELMQKKHREKT